MIELVIPNDLGLKVYINRIPDLSNLSELEYNYLVKRILDSIYKRLAHVFLSEIMDEKVICTYAQEDKKITTIRRFQMLW